MSDINAEKAELALETKHVETFNIIPSWEDAKVAPFIIEGIDLDDGSRTELASFASSGEAQEYLRRYTSHEDAGGWDLIEVYDLRGDPPDRLWYWERNAD